MMNNKKKEIINKDIKFPNELPPHSQDPIPQSIPSEENNQASELLIINNDDRPKTNYRFYQKEISVNNKRKTHFNAKKPIYAKVRSDSYKPLSQKVQISSYIYKNEKNIANKNLTTDYIRYNSNANYLIKNPIKEKSKNKLNKNYYQNQCEKNKNKNSKNLRLINSIVNNTDITDRDNNYIYNNDEQMQIINNTNYNFRPKNEINLNININNTDYDDNDYQIDANINRSKGGNINLNPIKKQYISFNKRANANSKNYQPSPRESHISYIYDYSQENNKNSYRVESPNAFNQLSIYPLNHRIKKRNKADFFTFNDKSNKKSRDRLKKQIEDSRLKFEKIREIEKKVKNYFSSNGLSIENRELYDQSATMIQSSFRAYYSRMKLFKELNSFVNMGLLIDLLKKIFFLRKSYYWENFLKGILSYLSFINDINIKNDNSVRIKYINNEKPVITDIKPVKKIPKSYRTKKSRKQLKNNNLLLMPQLCVSFDLIKNNNNINKDIRSNDINTKGDKKDLEEKIKKLLLENEQLKKNNQNLKAQYENYILYQEQNKFYNDDNIVKDTQKSVELQLGNDLNIPLMYSNKELKKSKLKLLLKNKMFKMKEYLHKYFLRFYYNAKLLRISDKKPLIYTKSKAKSSSNSIINNSNCEYSFKEKKDEKIVNKLKSVCINLDRKRKNILKNKFIKFYFKGLVHQLKNNKRNTIEDDNENKKDVKIA